MVDNVGQKTEEELTREALEFILSKKGKQK